MIAEPAALPGDHGARPDEDENVPPASPGPGQPRPEQSIGDPGAGPGRAPLVDGELVAQREDLELEGGARSEAGAKGREEGEKDRLHEVSKLHPTSAAPSASRRRQPTLRETSVMTVVLAFSGRTRASRDFTQ
jgi:hypothetical protein